MLKKRLQYRRYRRSHALSDISLTPLIDTALTLLVIFMIAAPAMQHAIKVTVPRARHVEQHKQESKEVVVHLDREKKLYLDDVNVTLQELVKQIKQTLGTASDQTVFVRADQEVSYGSVIELVDHLKTVGGITYVALAMQKQV